MVVVRFFGRFGAIIALLLAGSARYRVSAAEPPVARCFSNQPADSLARQIEPGPGVASAIGTGLPTPPKPAAALALSQKQAWLSELAAVDLTTTIHNRSSAAIRVARIDLVDWSFRIARDSDALRYRPLTHQQDIWYGSTYWSGQD
jgi:hypothetical protein